MNLPPPVLTNTTNAFAHHSMSIRVPGILRETQKLNPDYPPSIQAALDRLHDDLQSDAPIPMIDLPAPDYEEWLAAWQAHKGHTWLNTDWFFAETYLYRCVIQAVRWWETGRDPFAPKKQEEIDGDSLWRTLDGALETRGLLPEARLRALLEYTLWGNRIDLSHPGMKIGGDWHDDDLIADDSDAVIRHLLDKPGVVHVITDNAGTELAMDLTLADALLDGIAPGVILHVKLHPTFVSDATPADVLAFIALLESGVRGDTARGLGVRLRTAFNEGKLRVMPDVYWNSSRFLWDLPPRLAQVFAKAGLVVVKGDANYRRIVGDALWNPETLFREVLNYFPAPLLALRTMKSDSVVGLAPGLAEKLDPIDPLWRVNGRRGVIQAKV